MQASCHGRWPPGGRVHRPSRCDQCRQRVFVGMDHFHPRTGSSQCVDRRVEGDQAHGLRRWAQREDKHAFEAGRQIRVVRGVEAAIKVMVAVKQDGWRAEGSGGGGNRIDQIDPALAVESKPLPGFRIDGAARRRAGSTRSDGLVAVFMEPPGCDAMALQSDPVQRQGKSPEQIEKIPGRSACLVHGVGSRCSAWSFACSVLPRTTGAQFAVGGLDDRRHLGILGKRP